MYFGRKLLFLPYPTSMTRIMNAFAPLPSQSRNSFLPRPIVPMEQATGNYCYWANGAWHYN